MKQLYSLQLCFKLDGTELLVRLWFDLILLVEFYEV